jgi:hypothetical protein
MRTAKIVNAIICEDVRIERNGKQIIIGVYSSDIIVPETPALVPIMLWLQIDDVGREPEEYEFTGSMSDTDFVTGKFSVATGADSGRATISLGQFPLTIEREGTLKFDVKPAKNGRWKTAISMDVKLRPKPTA